MGRKFKKAGSEVKERWVQKMPRFFRQLTVLCACVAGTAFGINTAMMMGGAVAHDWWVDIYPLLIGVPTGMVIVCKLTVAGGYKEVDPGRMTLGNPILDSKDEPPAHQENAILDKDIEHMNGEMPL